MRNLNISEIKSVNGGIVGIIAVAAGSFIGGYIYGKLTKKEEASEPCKPNPETGSECA